MFEIMCPYCGEKYKTEEKVKQVCPHCGKKFEKYKWVKK